MIFNGFDGYGMKIEVSPLNTKLSTKLSTKPSTEPTIRDLLLKEIKNDPTNDGPRLTFADWCEENGEIHLAWFIREQIDRFHDKNGKYQILGDFEKVERVNKNINEIVGWMIENNQIENLTPSTHSIVCQIYAGSAFRLVTKRGFTSDILCTWSQWLKFVNSKSRILDQPIERVEITDLGENMRIDQQFSSLNHCLEIRISLSLLNDQHMLFSMPEGAFHHFSAREPKTLTQFIFEGVTAIISDRLFKLFNFKFDCNQESVHRLITSMVEDGRIGLREGRESSPSA